MKAVGVNVKECPICDSVEHVIVGLHQPRVGPVTLFQDIIDPTGVVVPKLTLRVKQIQMIPLLCTSCGIGFAKVDQVVDAKAEFDVNQDMANNPMMGG